MGGLFDRLIDMPDDEREVVIARLCDDDAEELRALLAADAAGDAMEQRAPRCRDAVAADWAREHESALPSNSVIGSWRILRELGRGGMGAVMLVERADGQFEQRAALKLIKRGMDSDAVLTRFCASGKYWRGCRTPASRG